MGIVEASWLLDASSSRTCLSKSSHQLADAINLLHPSPFSARARGKPEDPKEVRPDLTEADAHRQLRIFDSFLCRGLVQLDGESY